MRVIIKHGKNFKISSKNQIMNSCPCVQSKFDQTRRLVSLLLAQLCDTYYYISNCTVYSAITTFITRLVAEFNKCCNRNVHVNVQFY